MDVRSQIIPDLPKEQRPREKLVKDGVESLSDAELLAIFLRTGSAGVSAIQLGELLIKKHGSLAQLGRLEVKELSAEKGLGVAKSSQLLACFELGARVAKERLKKEPLNDPARVVKFLSKILGHHTTEKLLVLAVDPKLNLIKYKEVSAGTVSSTSAHPREILRPVLLEQASGFFLAHNHPSGDPTPSSADRAITKSVKEAAQIMQITFHDHIIIGKESDSHPPYYSFSQQGHL